MIVFTVVDQDVLRVDHFLGVVTLLSVIVTVCRQFIPDEVMFGVLVRVILEEL